MGTWGPGAFEDDVACDWLEDLFESDPVAFFQHCLDLSDQDVPGHVACVGVVCTAEMIHALVRGPRVELPEAAHRWLEQFDSLPLQTRPDQPSCSESDGSERTHIASLSGAAVAGLERILNERSEMRELWEDDGDRFDQWSKGMEDLIDRLQQVR